MNHTLKPFGIVQVISLAMVSYSYTYSKSVPNTREVPQFSTLHSLDFLLILLLLGIFDPTELINGIRQLYKTREGWLSPFPWCEEFQFFLGNIFTRLKVVRRNKMRGEITDVFVGMSSITRPV